MSASARPTLWWVRRDFRLSDNPALHQAVDAGAAVLPLFVLDPVLLGSAGPVRRAWLDAALHALDADLRTAGGPGLSVLHGRPAEAVPRVAREVGAEQVFVSADCGPYGRRRDARVAQALTADGASLRAVGSPYAIGPGLLSTRSGSPFQVFTPFHRAWQAHGVPEPAPPVRPASVDWLAAEGRVALPEPAPELAGLAGEVVAVRDWAAWLDRDAEGPADYKKLHDLPGPDATSHLSVALRWGHLHPRTVLADLATRRSEGAAALARQVVWRDFYADVLWHRPDAAQHSLRRQFDRMVVDDPDASPDAAARLTAWQQGRTGFPLVDAGMRQLLAEGWMHNRVRMVVASFLVKDLHLGWWHGARWFMDRLRDGDLAQNQLNWQWVAGCGNDAAPYYRVFNPTGQAQKFDADGRYVRRYVPELSDVPLAHLHAPAEAPGGPPAGYPAPIVDHKAERLEALDRYAQVKDQRP